MPDPISQLRRWLSSCDEPSIAVCNDSDPHCSEIPAPLFCFRSYLSGFRGSYGTLIVTRSEAHLWTDSRYLLQAQDILKDSSITLHSLNKDISPKAWIARNTPEHTHIHFFHEPISELRSYESICAPRTCVAHIHYPEHVWKNRPDVICNPIRVLPSGSSEAVVKNLETIRTAMTGQNCTMHIIANLDDIAHITNLRAFDLPYQQLFHAFLIIQKRSTQLFLRNAAQLTVEAVQLLAEASIEIRNYFDIVDALGILPKNQSVLIDPQQIDAGFLPYISASTVFGDQPSSSMKSIKSENELQNLQEVHCKDGAAMVNMLFAVEDADLDTLTENTIADYCREYRSSHQGYLGDSFSAICASGHHAASPHYETKASSSPLYDNTVLLIDSGGHYKTGTTDITRVLGIGDVPEHIKRDYTLVLKAHVHLSTLIFPAHTQGRDLNAVCKSVLWRHKRNFYHGTGHGVGYATTVHEFPPNISTIGGDTQLKPGMVFSVEPGIYIENSHGIRIENLVYVAHYESTTEDEFYYLHPLTLCPYEKALILPGILDQEEIAWINAYHERVYQELSPLIASDKHDRFKRMTSPL